jgi:hypothetical protein
MAGNEVMVLIKKPHPDQNKFWPGWGYGISILHHDRQVFWLTRTTLAFPFVFDEQ